MFERHEKGLIPPAFRIDVTQSFWPAAECNASKEHLALPLVRAAGPFLKRLDQHWCWTLEGEGKPWWYHPSRDHKT